MQIEQRRWTAAQGWTPPDGALGRRAQLVWVFGTTAVLEDPARYQEIRLAYPGARLFGSSTSGEIAGTTVQDDSLVTTAVVFSETQIHGVSIHITAHQTSSACGVALAQALPSQGLAHVVVLSDGLKVNGSELVAGMRRVLPVGVQITGGLAGDGARFERTLVLLDHPPESGRVAAVGFYGARLKVGYGSLGGWDPFGPERVITRSRGNVLYELDGQPALALYKKYLGEHAASLPAAGLLFPLSIRSSPEARPLVRTILGVEESAQSMTFAGDVPQGAKAQLMKANFDRLIDGASGAAKTSAESLDGSAPELAILVSCVGRRLVLKQRTEEELEAVQEALGGKTVLAGFYSYGEICPAAPNANCELHNQTMTVTTFSER